MTCELLLDNEVKNSDPVARRFAVPTPRAPASGYHCPESVFENLGFSEISETYFY